MGVLRLMESVYYLPLYKTNSRQQHYAAFMNRIINIAAANEIFLGGKPDKQNAFVALGPIRFDTVNISTPPYIPFQVPFYYSAMKEKVMKYDSVYKRGRYYLLFKGVNRVSDSLSILDRFQPTKNKEEVFYLVTPK